MRKIRVKLFERMENYWEGDVTQLVLAPVEADGTLMPFPAMSIPVADSDAATLTDGTIYTLVIEEGDTTEPEEPEGDGSG
jgi:hypothetical protein